MTHEMMGLPVNQANAVLDDDLMVRVGIPHKGGRLAFHAFNQNYPAMVSASAFWNAGKSCFQFPNATDISELDFALDSAGFTAMLAWKTKGTQPGLGGIYPWSIEDYVSFAATCGSRWFSQPDCCVEEAIATDRKEVDFRINATATFLEATLRVLYALQDQASATCSARVIANMFKPCVPVLQGRSKSDYLRSLDLMLNVWERWTPWLAMPTLIGIGSVCRRDLHHKTEGLYAVLSALEGNLPPGSRVHLFGVKGACLNEIRMLDYVASVDSMSWDYGSRVKAFRAGVSNTIAHRSSEMTRWMSKAEKQAKPAVGDQYRLSLF
ncbi:hypothetical protein LA345_40190 (plasmid) [Burkholderia vietnamiensis]|uniref:DeoxyPurine in DNA protein A domain-containing protein n=1 Tax=Burkholderia vietnamiensis (strain G4 / LMG 22486) TaxID=269482 RepID=A4JU71_BURVG|nr:conserved hypothetical protein [Burkholderia vietnamiensis G4]MCB4350014.1 hypothetical protein [Burkholderia vietnamiensis]